MDTAFHLMITRPLLLFAPPSLTWTILLEEDRGRTALTFDSSPLLHLLPSCPCRALSSTRSQREAGTRFFSPIIISFIDFRFLLIDLPRNENLLYLGDERFSFEIFQSSSNYKFAQAKEYKESSWISLISRKIIVLNSHWEKSSSFLTVRRAMRTLPYPGCVSDSILFSLSLVSFLFFSSILFPDESRGSFRSGRGRRADITRYWTGFAYACEIASVSRYTHSILPTSSHPPALVVVFPVPILFDDKESSYPSPPSRRSMQH